jgi:hypothetical protein
MCNAESKLLQTSLTSISNLNSGAFSIVINPFGEAYPELGNAEGVGFKTILSYIRDGGIFVNSHTQFSNIPIILLFGLNIFPIIQNKGVMVLCNWIQIILKYGTAKV